MWGTRADMWGITGLPRSTLSLWCHIRAGVKYGSVPLDDKYIPSKRKRHLSRASEPLLVCDHINQTCCNVSFF